MLYAAPVWVRRFFMAKKDEMGKTCCVIGHRKITDNEVIRSLIKNEVIYLTEAKNVDTFIFGSKSQFDNLCYKIITDLKKTRYPFLCRVAYVTKGQFVVLEEERERFENVLNKISGGTVEISAFDRIEYHKILDKSGKASYVERNRLMIDASDYCIFYYDENRRPPHGNSGTALAYAYATKKRKTIIDLFGER